MTIVTCCEQAREVAGDEGDVVGHDCIVHGPGSFLAARAALAESRAETAEARRQRENDAAKAAEIVRGALKDRDAARTEVSRLTERLGRAEGLVKVATENHVAWCKCAACAHLASAPAETPAAKEA